MRFKTPLLLIFCAVFLFGCKTGSNDPDYSNKILFSAQVINGTSSTIQIFTVNPDGTNLTQLTNFGNSQNGVFHLAWSPDHRKIVYNLASQIYLMNADGSNVVKLSDDNTVSDGCRFSPDGKFIVYETRVSSGAGAPYPFTDQLAIMTATGGVKKQITNLSTAANNYLEVYSGTWSPNGTRIYFIAASQNGGAVNVYSVNIDGSDLKIVLPYQAATEPLSLDFSPDGSKLLYECFNPSTGGTWAYTANAADGSNNKLLFSYAVPNSNTIVEMAPSYSPDGSQVVAGSLKDNPKGDLYIVNADGTVAKRLTNGSYGVIYDTSWR